MTLALPTGPRGRLLALGLAGVLAASAWIGVVAPLLSWHAERAETLASRRLLADRMEAVAETLPELRSASAAGAAYGPAPRALLEGASDAVAGAALQSQLQDMAAQAGASLTSAELLPAEAAGAYRRVGLRLAVNGSWPTLVTLLQAIEQASPRMLVDDLQMQPAPSLSVGAARPLDASLVVLAFRTGEERPATLPVRR